MTKQMVEDLNLMLRRKVKILTAVVIIFAVLFVGMTIFAFSEFEITIETTDITKVDQEAEANGDNNSVTQDANIQLEVDNTYLICGTVILCVLIITIGLVVYGKSKANNYIYKEKKDIN